MRILPEKFRANLNYFISKGFEPVQIASALNISPQAVSAWRKGPATPSKKNMEALARIFGVDAEELVSVDLTASTSEVQDAATSYGSKVERHLRRMNLQLEELIEDNNRLLLQLKSAN